MNKYNNIRSVQCFCIQIKMIKIRLFKKKSKFEIKIDLTNFYRFITYTTTHVSIFKDMNERSL